MNCMFSKFSNAFTIFCLTNWFLLPFYLFFYNQNNHFKQNGYKIPKAFLYPPCTFGACQSERIKQRRTVTDLSVQGCRSGLLVTRSGPFRAASERHRLTPHPLYLEKTSCSPSRLADVEIFFLDVFLFSILWTFLQQRDNCSPSVCKSKGGKRSVNISQSSFWCARRLGWLISARNTLCCSESSSQAAGYRWSWGSSPSNVSQVTVNLMGAKQRQASYVRVLDLISLSMWTRSPAGLWGGCNAPKGSLRCNLCVMVYFKTNVHASILNPD